MERILSNVCLVLTVSSHSNGDLAPPTVALETVLDNVELHVCICVRVCTRVFVCVCACVVFARVQVYVHANTMCACSVCRC